MKKLLAEARSRKVEILDKYDEAARELLRIAQMDGHFDEHGPEPIAWPNTAGGDSAESLEARQQRALIIDTIYRGMPARRDQRLSESYSRYDQLLPRYHEANRMYIQVQRQFLERDAGTAKDFLRLYQEVYLEALGRENPLPLDEAEAALVEFRVARVPLSHAQVAAERMQPQTDSADPLWDAQFSYQLEGDAQRLPLRELLQAIAERVVDAMAAGEHLAIRYNTFSNFIWFGICIWKVVTDLELLLARLRGSVRQRWIDKMGDYVLLAQGMLLKFLQAHLEDPAQIRPKDYWYGQDYSYLTRDMIDLVVRLSEQGNRLRARAPGLDVGAVPALELPSLLAARKGPGRFMEYGHVGVHKPHPPWRRRAKLLRWVQLFRHAAARKKILWNSEPDEGRRIAAAWKTNLDWAARSTEVFDIRVDVVIDPLFTAVADELEVVAKRKKIVFFPTHQSLLDHPVMYRVMESPQLLEALGWDEALPCTIASRARMMAQTAFKIGKREFSLIGLDPTTYDRMAEEVDGYVILEQSEDTRNPIQRFAKLLDQRPGIVYGAGTTAAFELQIMPMQHLLFAYLPEDIVIVPMAFRGIHSLWPKSPRGNMNVGSGVVEVYVSPPMLGETTLLPRKRSLRTQLEPATFFQAAHIATLLNPAFSDPERPGPGDR
jgi:hypothetical protein